MSKPKRRKPRPVRVTCPRCRDALPAAPAALLQQLADAMNACTNAGLDVKIRHGAIECDEGLILGPLTTGEYVARTRLYTEFPAIPEQGDRLD